MSRCPKCPGLNECVAGDGPECSEYTFLGEAPGSVENKRKKPFQGKTGDEVNRHYLPLTGLHRENVRVDNVISCLPPGDGKLDTKKQSDLDMLASCSEHHVYPYLEVAKPKLIIPMGAFACRSIDPTIDLELQHGIPTHTAWGEAFPMWHPAGGIHEPKKMLQIRTDWIRLRKYMIGKLRLPVDQFKGQEKYMEVESTTHLKSILQSVNDYTLACDTESTRRSEPFCLTFSVTPGTGYLIRASRLDLLEMFQGYLDQWRAPILFHNWLYDWTVVTKMGLTFPRRLIRDTMVLVFELGNLPQGLKALSFRELGMTMQDFDDLVRPYSTELVLDFYRRSYLEDWPKPEPEMVRGDGGLWKVYKPQGLNTKLKRFFTDLSKDPDKDLFKTWDNWESCHEMVEKECGPFPGKCITHVPFRKVIHYACRDADATLRLWPLLLYMKSQMRHTPQEKWQDNYKEAA